MTAAHLEVENLHTRFRTPAGTVKAVNGVSFTVCRAETLCLVGESGSGKTVTALSLLRLVRNPPGEIVSGSVRLGGLDILTLSEVEVRKIRGRHAAMIFQEPMTCLNPVFSIGNQLCEGMRLHLGISVREAQERAVELLNLVQIPDARACLRDYPHRLSGGMRQRVMIAMAIACDPELLIADEPTSALDVTIQAQILDLLNDLNDRFQISMIFITHDLGVVAEIGQKVAVMYAGKVVELAPVRSLFSDPKHPYTIGLLESYPRWDASAHRKGKLKAIPGTIPNLLDLPRGCAFKDRCAFRKPICDEQEPSLSPISPDRLVRCWLYD